MGSREKSSPSPASSYFISSSRRPACWLMSSGILPSLPDKARAAQRGRAAAAASRGALLARAHISQVVGAVASTFSTQVTGAAVASTSHLRGGHRVGQQQSAAAQGRELSEAAAPQAV
mmetsp:Transcript_5905/g.17645  ORF Transcript_5905/g.17645 Transcript_5905/m.17645 type:complete len:118 (-) Transcript_5905:462-815(-)